MTKYIVKDQEGNIVLETNWWPSASMTVENLRETERKPYTVYKLVRGKYVATND